MELNLGTSKIIFLLYILISQSLLPLGFMLNMRFSVEVLTSENRILFLIYVLIL